RYRIHDLAVECARDLWHASLQQDEEPIVVAAAVPQSMAARIEGDTRHEDEVDVVNRPSGERFARLWNPMVSRRRVAVDVRDDAKLEHACALVDARQQYFAAASQRGFEQRTRVPLAAKRQGQQRPACAGKRWQRQYASADRG